VGKCQALSDRIGSLWLWTQRFHVKNRTLQKAEAAAPLLVSIRPRVSVLKAGIRLTPKDNPSSLLQGI
jgi:hypothetical protein